MKTFMGISKPTQWQKGLKSIYVSSDYNVSQDYANNKRAKYDNSYFEQICFDSVKAIKHSGVAYLFNQEQVDKVLSHLKDYDVQVSSTDGIFVLRGDLKGKYKK